MSLDEISKRILDNFFSNFFCITITMGIYRLLMGFDFVTVSSIFAVAVMSALTGSAELVLYSKKELHRLELFVRHIICVLVGIVIVLSIAIFMGWISWNQPRLVLAFAGMVVIVHVIVMAIDFYRTKLKTTEMMKKIRELNK